MSIASRHILQQTEVIRALAQSAIDMAVQSRSKAPAEPMQTPGPTFRNERVTPLPADLLRDYIRHVGGDPSWYRGQVPAHLFPQWCFPLSTKTLKGIPYPIAKVMNGGCRLEMNGPLPAGEPLVATAQLTSIDDNGTRAVLTQKMTTGPASNPEAVTGYFYPVVPLAKGGSGKAKPTVPADAREVTRWRLKRDSGLDFAKLTGDFNPIHWVNGYARAFGFRGVIIHGFSTMARAIEGLNRNLFLGDTSRLTVFDCKFTRPLHVPADVGLYIDGKGGVWVGDAPGGPAYLVGTYEYR